MFVSFQWHRQTPLLGRDESLATRSNSWNKDEKLTIKRPYKAIEANPREDGKLANSCGALVT